MEYGYVGGAAKEDTECSCVGCHDRQDWNRSKAMASVPILGRCWSLRRINNQTLLFPARRRWDEYARGGPQHHRLLSLVLVSGAPHQQHHSSLRGSVYGTMIRVRRPVLSYSNAAAADNETMGTGDSHDRDDDNPTSQHQQHGDELLLVQEEEDKWEHAIHPFQEPYWTGRKDPAEYLAYMQNVTLPQFRRTRRQRNLILLRQAEQVVWQVELMNRAYRDIVVLEEEERNADKITTTTTTITAAEEEENQRDQSQSTCAFAPTVASSLASARQRYHDYRQEALEERWGFVRLRNKHLKGKNHYKFAMQHFPIPEPLANLQTDGRTDS